MRSCIVRIPVALMLSYFQVKFDTVDV